FIWGLDRIPSVAYPYAQRMWELNAANSCIMYSSTMGEFSMFEQAFNVVYLGFGAVAGVVLFGGMQLLGAPIMLTYGVVRGLGQSLPHSILPQFLGALIGHFYFKKRLKLKWRQYIPVVAAGFSCGMGLITTVGVGVTFLSKAVIKLPF
ncbi:MAG: peptide transporter, partial [Lentisphaerae bacterium]|nr:peptide transporter [Lentisphaerota bacterium]